MVTIYNTLTTFQAVGAIVHHLSPSTEKFTVGFILPHCYFTFYKMTYLKKLRNCRSCYHTQFQFSILREANVTRWLPFLNDVLTNHEHPSIGANVFRRGRHTCWCVTVMIVIFFQKEYELKGREMDSRFIVLESLFTDCSPFASSLTRTLHILGPAQTSREQVSGNPNSVLSTFDGVNFQE